MDKQHLETLDLPDLKAELAKYGLQPQRTKAQGSNGAFSGAAESTQLRKSRRAASFWHFPVNKF